MWNRSPPTRASSWSAWKSPMWTRSTASRRQSPSGRRTRRAIRARRWPPPPSATIFCACCGRARAGRSAPTAARACERDTVDQVAAQAARAARGLALVRAVSAAASTPPAMRCAIICSNCARKASTGCSRAARIFEFSTPESLLDIDFTKPVFVLVDRLAIGAGTAPAPGRYRRDLLSRSRRSHLRKPAAGGRAAALQREVSVQDLRQGVRRAGADPVQLQHAGGRVPALPGLRQHHRLRHGPGDPRSARCRSRRARSIRGPSRSTGPGWAISKRAARQGPHERAGLRSDATAERETLEEFIRRFFDELESKKYKVHVRVFLSRYRGYTLCPECGGARLRPEAL